MNNIKNIESITEQELNAGIFGGLSKGSWHEKYKDSAWVFLGGFPFELSEGDIICVMSQWGEIEDINLVRDKVTNKSKGFAFIKYEDNRSTILAVDNFNGTKLLGRTLRCDHVDEYRLPKEVREKELEALENDPEGRVEIGPGHAYKNAELADDHNVSKGVDLWKKPDAVVEDTHTEERHKKHKKDKKEKKETKEKKIKKEKKSHNDRRDGRDDHSYSASSDGSERKHSRSTRADGDGERSYDRDRDRDRGGDMDSRDRHHGGRTSDSRAAEARAADSSRASTSAPASTSTATAAAAYPRPGTSSSQQAFSGGAVASWRGNRDPVAAAPVHNNKGAAFSGNKRPYDSSGDRPGGDGGYGNSGGSGNGNGSSGASSCKAYGSSSSGGHSSGLSGIGGMNRTR